MARKKSSNGKNQAGKAEDEIHQCSLTREDKVMNAMINTSVILMSTMMGAFTQVMVSATGAMAQGMAQAMGGKEAGNQVNHEVTQKLPEADQKMKEMISDIRKNIYAQMAQKKKELAPLLSDPAFEEGPRIIEKYDFKLPRLTEELDDNALTHYSQLIANEDPGFAKMFGELAQWLNSLPKPPEQRTNKRETRT